MNFKDKESTLMYIMGLLWFIILVMGLLSSFVPSLSGLWFPAMFVMIAAMVVMLVRGSMRKGKFSTQFVIFPIGVWAIVWIAGFALAQYHAIKYDNVLPAFTPLGLHPSFFWILILYWIVGTLVIMLGYYYKYDLWLTESEWNQFVKEIASISASPVKKPSAKKAVAKSKTQAKSKVKKK